MKLMISIFLIRAQTLYLCLYVHLYPYVFTEGERERERMCYIESDIESDVYRMEDEAWVKLSEPSFQLPKVLIAWQGLLCLEARHSEAVEELRRACYLAPKEPGIHFHLGCACRSLGDSVAALKHFTFALDLANDRHLTDATRKELRELRGQSA